MLTAESMPSLSLAPHVRTCISDGQVVLLDLRRSRYLSMGTRASHALAARIRGWPCPKAHDATDSAAPTAAAVQAAVIRLLDLELVCACGAASALDPTLPPASESIDLDAAWAIPRARTPELIHVLFSSVLAAWWLRRRSLDEIASQVSAWHAGASSRGQPGDLSVAQLDPAPLPVAGQPSADESSYRATPRRGTIDGRRSIEDAALVFEKLRPLVFSTKDCCLRDSLALARFLALQGLPARWVIGVKTRPFGAHAWVQHENLVLNDHHEHVSGFRPILVV